MISKVLSYREITWSRQITQQVPLSAPVSDTVLSTRITDGKTKEKYHICLVSAHKKLTNREIKHAGKGVIEWRRNSMIYGAKENEILT